jgi:hypothetical protein
VHRCVRRIVRHAGRHSDPVWTDPEVLFAVTQQGGDPRSGAEQDGAGRVVHAVTRADQWAIGGRQQDTRLAERRTAAVAAVLPSGRLAHEQCIAGAQPQAVGRIESEALDAVAGSQVGTGHRLEVVALPLTHDAVVTCHMQAAAAIAGERAQVVARQPVLHAPSLSIIALQAPQAMAVGGYPQRVVAVVDDAGHAAVVERLDPAEAAICIALQPAGIGTDPQRAAAIDMQRPYPGARPPGAGTLIEQLEADAVEANQPGLRSQPQIAVGRLRQRLYRHLRQPVGELPVADVWRVAELDPRSGRRAQPQAKQQCGCATAAGQPGQYSAIGFGPAIPAHQTASLANLAQALSTAQVRSDSPGGRTTAPGAWFMNASRHGCHLPRRLCELDQWTPANAAFSPH